MKYNYPILFGGWHLGFHKTISHKIAQYNKDEIICRLDDRVVRSKHVQRNCSVISINSSKSDVGYKNVVDWPYSICDSVQTIKDIVFYTNTISSDNETTFFADYIMLRNLIYKYKSGGPVYHYVDDLPISTGESMGFNLGSFSGQIGCCPRKSSLKRKLAIIGTKDGKLEASVTNITIVDSNILPANSYTWVKIYVLGTRIDVSLSGRGLNSIDINGLDKDEQIKIMKVSPKISEGYYIHIRFLKKETYVHAQIIPKNESKKYIYRYSHTYQNIGEICYFENPINNSNDTTYYIYSYEEAKKRPDLFPNIDNIEADRVYPI